VALARAKRSPGGAPSKRSRLINPIRALGADDDEHQHSTGEESPTRRLARANGGARFHAKMTGAKLHRIGREM